MVFGVTIDLQGNIPEFALILPVGISFYTFQSMGYHFKINFNHPYIATSMRNFWQRWHISLSTWFRDYVYIPLGSSKSGKAKALLFMTLTMLISGL